VNSPVTAAVISAWRRWSERLTTQGAVNAPVSTPCRSQTDGQVSRCCRIHIRTLTTIDSCEQLHRTPISCKETIVAGLQSVRIQRFKGLEDAAIDLKSFNVLVGANNAGKSSVIQGIHFAIAILQTIALEEKWSNSGRLLKKSINPNKLIYTPTDDVYALGLGGTLIQKPEQQILFTFVLENGKQVKLGVRKGRNQNIQVEVTNPTDAEHLSSLESPFSIFSPGLAGIAKDENWVSDGILLRTQARGDANLVLRNILMRLWGTSKWELLMDDLHEVFPTIQLEVQYRDKTDEYISVNVSFGSASVPLELAGTGVLQAIQILSYIHQFSPEMIVLDEPDSHLHPNNQRLLCSLLETIADERGTQVILTTVSSSGHCTVRAV
jgi:hypothetical protein